MNHMRKRLIAIPYSAAKYGVRLDYSRVGKSLVFYYWSPKGIGHLHFGTHGVTYHAFDEWSTK